LTTIVVPGVLAGTRIDRAVSLLTGVARSEARRLVEEGQVSINGRALTAAAHKLAGGESLEFDLPEALVRPVAAPPAPSADVPFTVVYEDADMLVVDKPAGVVVHPGSGVREGTLVSGLLSRYPDLADFGGERPGIVHRLDKGTSGLLIVARNDEAQAALSAQLASRTLRRQYRACVRGHIVADEGMVDAAVGRSRRDRTRMAIAAGAGSRPARTAYRVLRRASVPFPATDAELTLETGRTHQIRVHMAAIGHPVLGDATYGDRGPALGLSRPFLHAWRLGVVHPRTGEELSFESELPEELKAAAAQLS
jgi:23S rRNA pseudouridine1911/1915/1917 synthase